MSKSALMQGAVAVSALGLTFTLKYDFNVLCDLEADHPGIMDGELNENRLKSPAYIRKLFASGLKAADDSEVPEPTAGRIISEIGLKTVIEKIGLAILVGFGFNPDGTPMLQPEAGDAEKN